MQVPIKQISFVSGLVQTDIIYVLHMHICIYISIYIYIANPELAKKVAKADLIIYQIAINLHFS